MTRPPTRSWGRTPRLRQSAVRLGDRDAPLPCVHGDMLPWGNGRSYGDSCQVPGGTLLMTQGLDRFIGFDSETGVLECEPGVLLADVIALTLPAGWFLPVTPGTRFVTVGGAIANDVHGKNHHRAGSFGHHVEEIELLRSDGKRIACGPARNPDWFAATVGGLGLTGLITRVRVRLRRVNGATLDVHKVRFAGLDGFFECSRNMEACEYNVAWVDSTATGTSLGRGIFQAADHTAEGSARTLGSRSRIVFPFTPPLSLVMPWGVRAFNTQQYLCGPRRPKTRTTHFESFFYPLDAIDGWNRMYGRRGFLQYQCVIPPEDAFDAIREILGRIARAGAGSFLTVLKQFGDRPAPGLLSFPRRGTTLAIDFAHRGESTLRLLDTLDEVTLQAKGAIYPAKDARMSATAFAASFPQLSNFQNFVDPRFSSGLWHRVCSS